jgi:DnaJ-class molecular chaperone
MLFNFLALFDILSYNKFCNKLFSTQLRVVNIMGSRICGTCNGNGWIPVNSGPGQNDHKKCPACDGDGFIRT